MAHKGYTLNYFIDYFSSIPTNRWTEGALCESGSNRLCALGHALAGPNPSETRLNAIREGEFESNARTEALQNFLDNRVEDINDGSFGRELGVTPRGRILRALRNRKRTGSVLGR